MTDLDVRDLEPPEPMARILEALLELPPAETLRVRIHRQPYPLYGILQRDGYPHETRTLDDGSFELLIRRGAAT